tara:strand:- start:174 stop:482 length:309 start_codon:yes stop_codon:yes gene_type:complete
MATNNYDKIRNSRNELEATLRIRGISKRRFGTICNIKGTTIDKYIKYPHMLRYYHMKRIAEFLNIDVRDIIDIIEVDIPENLIVKGEEDFTLIDSLPSKYRD